MAERQTLSRLLALPLAHKLIAAAIAIAVAGGFVVVARTWVLDKTRTSASPALLAFETSADLQQKSAILLAHSILGDDVVRTLSSRVGLSGSPSDFQNHLVLEQPSSEVLQVSYRDKDAKRAANVSNAVAGVLAAWIPVSADEVQAAASAMPPPSTPVPAAPAPPAPVVTYHVATSQTRRKLSAHILNMEGEQNDIDLRLAAADREQRKLAMPSHADTRSSARQQLDAQLQAAQKRLEDLRQKYTDEYPDVQAAREKITEIQNAIAALPSLHPQNGTQALSAEDAHLDVQQLRAKREQLTQQIAIEKKQLASEPQAETIVSSARPAPQIAPRQPAPVAAAIAPPKVVHKAVSTVKPFSLLESASVSTTVARRSNMDILWAALLGPMCGIGYLFLAARRNTPVHGQQMLEAALPGVALLGQVPRMNL